MVRRNTREAPQEKQSWGVRWGLAAVVVQASGRLLREPALQGVGVAGPPTSPHVADFKVAHH
ncbi:hypothetical protein E2C01_045968 [Portunus trituberculatus]|uniref:Uncharacterized protein n=1 Tax=Portunus trituberculatus TaxID=210409 RepID=A0A5B7G3D3_PORTR|nr:hypothetical protein [Portunus trituberculatus]